MSSRLLEKNLIDLRWKIVSSIRSHIDITQNTNSLKIRYKEWINKKKGIAKPQIEDIYKGLEREYGCFEFSHCGTENCLIRNVNVKLFSRCFEDTLEKIDEHYVIKSGNLKMDLKNATLDYKGKTVDIDPSENYIKVLIFFVNNPNKILTYTQIAKYIDSKVDISEYDTTDEEDINAVYAGSINNYKSKLTNFLIEELGIPEETLKGTITNIKGTGYKFLPDKLK